MIKVYFESSAHAELVATFDSEETYNACLPALLKEAKANRMTVTESVEDGRAYFLFGSEAVKEFLNTGKLSEDFEGALHEFDAMDISAGKVLDGYDGWHEYHTLTKAEYDALNVKA